MALLTEIAPGLNVAGILPGAVVEIKSTKLHGDNTLEVLYKESNGKLGEAVLNRDDEKNLTIVGGAGRTLEAPKDACRFSRPVHSTALPPLRAPGRLSRVFRRKPRRLRRSTACVARSGRGTAPERLARRERQRHTDPRIPAGCCRPRGVS